jgi:16S rRNA (cytosine967-C5)-methyltransferase
VLVDAPCSGTGTWRRNPESRWRLNPDRLARLVDEQLRLLDIAAQLVRPGGTLVYAVCSLLDAEGAEQIAAFLSHYRDWRADVSTEANTVHQQGQQLGQQLGRPHGPGLLLTPYHDGCDGFFMARLHSPSR